MKINKDNILKLKNNGKINREDKYIIRIYDTPKTKSEISNYKNNKNIKDIIHYLENFEQILKEKSPNYNLNSFLYNSSNLELEYVDTSNEDRIAGYLIFYNKIIMQRDTDIDIEEFIYHELFHMGSSKKSDEMLFVGFDQITDKMEFGVGLNEIYTDILTRRYFDSMETWYQNYIYLVEPLEKLVGKEKMEELYSNSDLCGLVTEMINYISLEDAISYIYNLDIIMNNKRKYNENLDIKFIKEISKKENEIIINAFVNKLIIENNYDEFCDNMDSVYCYAIYDGKRKVNIINNKTKRRIKRIENCYN